MPRSDLRSRRNRTACKAKLPAPPPAHVCSGLYYAAGKFACLTGDMARGNAPLRTRIQAALWHISAVQELDLPPELGAQLHELRGRIRQHSVSVETTFAHLSDREVRDIAHGFLDLGVYVRSAERRAAEAELRDAKRAA
jgi:hypothetical protein